MQKNEFWEVSRTPCHDLLRVAGLGGDGVMPETTD